jgi:hypothetical protein
MSVLSVLGAEDREEAGLDAIARAVGTLLLAAFWVVAAFCGKYDQAVAWVVER